MPVAPVWIAAKKKPMPDGCTFIPTNSIVVADKHLADRPRGMVAGGGTFDGQKGAFAIFSKDFRVEPILPVSISSTAIKKLSASDLGVQTRKWEDRTIEAVMNCFYADKDEFRCFVDSARIDFSEISPAEARRRIEDNCDTIDKSVRQACKFTIRFVWASSEMKPLGVSRQHFIRAKNDAAEIVPSPARRR